MVDMALNQILPAALKYSSELAAGINRKRDALGSAMKAHAESCLVERLSVTSDALYDKCERLLVDLAHVPTENQAATNYYNDVIIPQMQAIRVDADLLEKITAKSYWPYPQYSDMLFY